MGTVHPFPVREPRPAVPLGEIRLSPLLGFRAQESFFGRAPHPGLRICATSVSFMRFIERADEEAPCLPPGIAHDLRVPDAPEDASTYANKRLLSLGQFAQCLIALAASENAPPEDLRCLVASRGGAVAVHLGLNQEGWCFHSALPYDGELLPGTRVIIA